MKKTLPLFLVLLATLQLHAEMTSFYDFETNTLAGQPAKLSDYHGKVALVVNVASHCGFTPQYQGLEKLYTDLKDRGFVILAFPSNDFGGQEPGTPVEIATFCSSKYNVTFPMFEKIDVKGPTKSPLYGFLAVKFKEPSWNFCKYLISKKGEVIKFYDSKTTPSNVGLLADIEGELAK